MRKTKIAGACLNQTPIDWAGNVRNIKDAIAEARQQGAEILCLPELCISGYGCEDLFLSDWLIEKSIALLFEIAEECEHIAVTLGLPLVFHRQVYNTTCLIENRVVRGFYAKQFLANDGIHYEQRWFTPWQANQVDEINIKGRSYPFGDLTFDLYGIKIGFEICEDAWNEARPARRLYERGVQLILNPSASHFAFAKHKMREKLVTSSSERFECAYLYVNMLGNQSGRIIYDGDILLADRGRLLGRNRRLSFRPYRLMVWEMDSSGRIISEHNSADWEGKHTEFTRAVSLGLYDYLRKSSTKGFTLSLSGGADSSCIAVLTADMVKNAVDELGEDLLIKNLNLTPPAIAAEDRKERNKAIVSQLLTTAYQSSKNSSAATLDSAKRLAASIGASFHHWAIDEVVKENTGMVERAIGGVLNWQCDDISLQNIQARCRSPIIWMLANIKEQILLTTSNRSEGAVGYATMDGDTSGSLAPIAGVDKEFILEWLQYAEHELGYEGLHAVNKLSPSAELRPAEMMQRDETDLMPYPVLRAIEAHAIRAHKAPKACYQALLEEFDMPPEMLKSCVRKFFRLWSVNQWKRERLAPSFHLDDFNVDPKTWCRFPILSGGFREELEEL